MAVKANTFVSTSAVGNREELHDVVDRTTPEDSPIYSMVPKGKCSSKHPEWEYEGIDTPGDNIVTEGDEYTFDAIDTPTRVGNYTQIMRKSFRFSGTQEAVSNAGNAEKMKHEKLLKGIELRRDVEYAIVKNNASVAGADRELGGLPSWLETNVDRGSGGADGGFSSGTGLTVAATDGAQRTFTKSLLDGVMEDAYTSGADVSDVIMAPYVKSVFVTFMSDANVAQQRQMMTVGNTNAIIANVDIYDGAHGKVKVHMNRVMSQGGASTARNIFLLDKRKLSFDWLRPIKEMKNVAHTGDAKQCVLLGEGTLRVKNEVGLAAIADVFGLSASS